MEEIGVFTKDNTTYYVYDPVELTEWWERGFKHGDAGWLLLSKTEDEERTWLNYVVFGTTEFQNKDYNYLTIVENPLDKLIVTTRDGETESFDLDILDFGEEDENKNNDDD